MSEGFTVFIIDDDPGVLKALSRLLRAADYETRIFASPRAFLASHDPSLPGCAVVDVAMPDVDGLALQRVLAAAGIGRPIIFISGKGDVPTSVQAMKAGAIDFLTKPVSGDDLVAAIARARQAEAGARRIRSERAVIEAGLAKLTPREREVLDYVVAGQLNKQIAGELGTVEKTIKVHRARMMHKLGVRTVQDLVRLAERVDIRPSPSVAQRGPL